MKKRVLGNTQNNIPAIGLSEAAADTIRRAAAIHPISAVQSEYSIFSRDIETSVIPACVDVGATLGAYEIQLNDDEQTTLDHLADRVKGDRYDERGMAIING